MRNSAMTTKGQVTIPRDIRRQLGLKPGDKVSFMIENDHVILYRKQNDIEASFGICKPKKSVSLKNMESAIRKRGGHAGG